MDLPLNSSGKDENKIWDRNHEKQEFYDKKKKLEKYYLW